MYILNIELKEDDYWLITSPDIFGLILCGRRLVPLLLDLPESIELLRRLNNVTD